MYKLFLVLTFSFLLILEASAKTLEQKKEELEKIYKTGAISKAEYKKAKKFLEDPEIQDKKTLKKKKFSLKKNSKKTKKKSEKNNNNEEKIKLKKVVELGEIIQLDNTFFPDSMIKEFKSCNNSFKCKGQKAGSYMWKAFSKPPSYGQRFPGKMIKSMAMYEVFYASQLYEARKSIERFKEDNYQEAFFDGTAKSLISKKKDKKKKRVLFSKKREDEEKLRSLIGMNEGKKNMREALGMNMETPTKEAIQKFWLLGEFLELGLPVNNKIKIDEDIKKRQDKLDIYKATISTLKKKLEERAEEKKTSKDKL